MPEGEPRRYENSAQPAATDGIQGQAPSLDLAQIASRQMSGKSPVEFDQVPQRIVRSQKGGFPQLAEERGLCDVLLDCMRKQTSARRHGRRDKDGRFWDA